MPFASTFLPVIALLGPTDAAPSLARVDFDSRFGDLDGCFILKDLKNGWTLRYNEKRCHERLSPCSTFKIFNALAALDCGALAGANAKFRWDGKPQIIRTWEQDHTLATAIRDSVLWYFQKVARLVGQERMKCYLDLSRYGNTDMSGGIDRFWLDNSLEISAEEQVEFLGRLFTGKLPFNDEATETVKGLIKLDSGPTWVLSGKTGSAAKEGKCTLGWFVGHIEIHGRAFVFAANTKAEAGAYGAGTRRIVRRILQDLDLLPVPPERPRRPKAERRQSHVPSETVTPLTRYSPS